MKNRIFKGALAILMVVAFASNAFAIDQSVSVSATASIGGVTSMSVLPTSIVYGTTNIDAYPTTPADNKVVVTYASNYNPWKISIATNNTQVPDHLVEGDDGRYSKGGLATVDGLQVIPNRWFAKNPTSGTTVPAATALGAYNFVKDKRDQDDPATVDNPGTPDIVENNESWAAAFADGYANIAYGNAGGGVCIDPANTTAGPTQYQGDAVDGAIAVYLAGYFGTMAATPPIPATAGDYTTSYIFDLYHE